VVVVLGVEVLVVEPEAGVVAVAAVRMYNDYFWLQI